MIRIKKALKTNTAVIINHSFKNDMQLSPFTENLKTSTTIIQVSRIKHETERLILNFMLMVTSRQGVRTVRSRKYTEVLKTALIWFKTNVM